MGLEDNFIISVIMLYLSKTYEEKYWMFSRDSQMLCTCNNHHFFIGMIAINKRHCKLTCGSGTVSLGIHLKCGGLGVRIPAATDPSR